MLSHPNKVRLILSILVFLVLVACSEKAEEEPGVDPGETIAEMLARQSVQGSSSNNELPPGKVEKYETYLATIHSFTSQDDWLVNSHIIETESSLVLVDTQLSEPFVQQLKDYIASLGKPLERIYLSHAHLILGPGIEEFEGVPVYAQEPVIEAILSEHEGLGTSRGEIKNLLVHSDIIDGLTYEFELAEIAEARFQTLVRLPEIGVSIVQDLISNNAHVQFAQADIQSWVRSLAVLIVDAKDHQIFVGHGYPARVDVGQIGAQIRYLQTLQKLLDVYDGSGPESLAATIKSAYPEFEATVIVELSARQYHQAFIGEENVD